MSANQACRFVMEHLERIKKELVHDVICYVGYDLSVFLYSGHEKKVKRRGPLAYL